MTLDTKKLPGPPCAQPFVVEAQVPALMLDKTRSVGVHCSEQPLSTQHPSSEGKMVSIVPIGPRRRLHPKPNMRESGVKGKTTMGEGRIVQKREQQGCSRNNHQPCGILCSRKNRARASWTSVKHLYISSRATGSWTALWIIAKLSQSLGQKAIGSWGTVPISRSIH